MMMGVDMVGVKVEAATGLLPPAKPPLIRQYYKRLNTCANVESFVQFQVKKYWDNNRALTPKLVKLLYTDCMVNVCAGALSFSLFLSLLLYIGFYTVCSVCP